MINKFGILLFLLAGTASWACFMGNLPSDFWILPFILFVMGFIGGFPQLFMKIINPRLKGIMNDLQSQLTQIGISSEIINADDSRAIEHHYPTFSNDILNMPNWGVVCLNNCNIDLIEVKTMSNPGWGAGSLSVFYVYSVKVSSENEEDLQATSTDGGLWSGGKLSEVLNADRELKAALAEIGFPSITVREVKSEAYVAIYKERLSLGGGNVVPTYGIDDYPTAPTLRAYDIVAGHVRKMCKYEL